MTNIDGTMERNTNQLLLKTIFEKPPIISYKKRLLSRDTTLKVRAGLSLLPFHRVNASSGNGGDVITLIIVIVVIVEDQ